MGRCYQEALDIWLAHRRRGRDRQRATTTRRSRTRSRPTACSAPADLETDPERPGSLPRGGAATSTTGSATGAARRTRCGASATTDYFRRHAGLRRSTRSGEALEIFREVGDRTMEAWALHMLGTGLLRAGDVDEAQGPCRARHPPLPRGRRRRRADPDPRRPVGDRGGRGRPAAGRPAAGRGAQPHDRDRDGAGRLRRGLVRGGHAARRPCRTCPRRTSPDTEPKARR